ncbi:hypothetical protein ACIPYQ_39645 [Streptomyces sp. NPDC090045]|uniref:hypothetical protein n=1 Tax=Streptomyces sp. NPDC090045 TaxID=3365927 RepID=UPI003802BEEA
MNLDRIRTGIHTATARTEDAVTGTLTSPVTAAFVGVIAGWAFLAGDPLDGTAALLTAVGLTATCAAARLGDKPPQDDTKPRWTPGGRPTVRPALTGPTDTPEEPSVRWTMTACHIDVDVWGWELEGDHYATHDEFHPDDFDRDVEAAKTWAEGIIGGPQLWIHTRVEGFDRWHATAPDPR